MHKQIYCQRALLLDQTQLERLYPHTTVTWARDNQFLSELKHNPNGIIADANSNVPLLHSLELISDITAAQTYLTTRDEIRAGMDPLFKVRGQEDGYWASSRTTLAAQAIAKTRSHSLRAFATRMVYDKHLTGRAKARNSKNIEDAVCRLCEAEMEDQEHILLHCCHPQMNQIREHHNNHIINMIETLPSGSKQDFSRQIHELITSVPRNYDLGLGRTHTHIIPGLRLITEQFPQQVTLLHTAAVTYTQESLIKGLALYATRQQLINIQDKNNDNSVHVTIPDLNAERQ
jgi:hypothetical protein